MAARAVNSRTGGPKMEKPCIVSNGLTMQGFLITYCSPCELITYCSPCELSSV